MSTALCEIRVFSRRHRFAGTLDVLGRWDGCTWLADFKTGSPRDVGAQWQTAAYYGALLEMLTNGDRPEDLVFDPLLHAYTLDGERLPSVTQILQASGIIDFSKIPQPILYAARDRGSAVHEAAHYYNEGDLDVAQFEREFPEYWPYLSAWITFRHESRFEIVTGFDALGSASHIKRCSIQLRKDGTYRVEPYTAATDYSEFLTLLRAQEIVARHRGSWIELTEAA